ncbi:hypothetical protein I5G81_gp61 [Mycobacterium phage Shandong1]|uniref:Uncharacterized protein n=1 Tax=Mycobacterium phage Shandong1 TaxID=1983447 RepID=A0A1X9SHK8_9CAUD|nr:hypothetical protein I5G81_gp61 [Mycobacterium phage Shandong1]ARQ95500.1 hypothetical protein [Mycobacterium phage Shandong1]
MSNRNYVKVGQVEVERLAPKGSRGLDTTEVVNVGVRTDTGELLVSFERNDRSHMLPPLPSDKADQLAEMLTRGASLAGGLREAYETYQAALRQAEDALTAAMAVHQR